MKIFQKTLLESQEITWLVPGQSAPFMQGAALNKLNSEYPARPGAKQGYFLYQPSVNLESYDLPNKPIDLPAACYYLIERKTKLESGEIVMALIAFKENGDSIEGAAIFI